MPRSMADTDGLGKVSVRRMGCKAVAPRAGEPYPVHVKEHVECLDGRYLLSPTFLSPRILVTWPFSPLWGKNCHSETGHWRPVGDTENSVPLSWLQDFDPGFVGVSCYPKTLTDGLKVRNIRIFPKKGFSQLYFPVENFNPELYLAPLVMVQVEGVKKGENVTIECSLRAQNALFLWGYGTLTVNFVGNQNDAQSETSSSGSGGSLNNTKVQ